MMILLFLSFLFPSSDSLLVKKLEIKDFANAVSITSDSRENIYVLDANANQIIKYNSNLDFILRNGKQGWMEGQYDSPTYIDGSSGLDIYVSDGNNKRVQRLDLNLVPISTLLTYTPDFQEDLRFRTPVASLVMNSNQFFVIDGDNNRIVVYQNSRTPVSLFAHYTSGKGQLLRPVKLLKDGNNNIYVLDKEIKSILKFDNLGNYVMTLSIDNLEAYTIYGNTLYMFDGKEIVLYDLEKNAVTERKKLPKNISKKKIRDILVLNNNKYFLLGKNTLSLWQDK